MLLSIAFEGVLPSSKVDALTLSIGASEHPAAASAGATKTLKLAARPDANISAAAAIGMALLKIDCFPSIFFRKMSKKIVFISLELFSKSYNLRQKDQCPHLPIASRSKFLRSRK
jgi:hypothetical protein